MNKERPKQNLLEETLNFLKARGKTPEDVEWCGRSDSIWFSWEDFVKLAKETYYDNSHGTAYIQGIYIVGKDWYLEREEYAGAERWEFKPQLLKPKKHFVPNNLFDILSTFNKKEKEQLFFFNLRFHASPKVTKSDLVDPNPFVREYAQQFFSNDEKNE